MTMGDYRMDNGDAFMRAQRDPYPTYLIPAAWSNPQPEPEDTTGLKMLDEFLAKRRRARDGDERK
jgi:hypothetical protein